MAEPLYLLKDNQQYGPYEEHAIKGWLQTGQCSPDDMAWRDGMKEWQPLGMLFPPAIAPASTPSFTPSFKNEVDSAELEEAKKHIRNAYIAGIISGVLTLVITLLAIAMGRDLFGVDAWALIDVVLVFGLTFGIYRKSRVCAVVMFVYFVISKIIMWMQIGKPTGLIMALIFGYYYFRGVLGTIAYHRLIKHERP